jgi:hypothetical protein
MGADFLTFPLFLYPDLAGLGRIVLEMRRLRVMEKGKANGWCPVTVFGVD